MRAVQEAEAPAAAGWELALLEELLAEESAEVELEEFDDAATSPDPLPAPEGVEAVPEVAESVE